jgi:hypothetical protein
MQDFLRHRVRRGLARRVDDGGQHIQAGLPVSDAALLLALTLIHLRIPELFHKASPSLSRIDDTGERIGVGERARAMAG